MDVSRAKYLEGASLHDLQAVPTTCTHSSGPGAKHPKSLRFVPEGTPKFTENRPGCPKIPSCDPQSPSMYLEVHVTYNLL